LPSPENPQFEQQPTLTTEPQLPPPTYDPLTAGSLPPAAPFFTAPPPPRDPVWSGWDVLLIAGLAFISMLVLQLIVLVGAQLLIYPHENMADVAQKPILLLISQFLIYIPVIICMVLLVRSKYDAPFWKSIHWNWPERRWAYLALLLGAVMLIVLSMLQIVLPMPKDTPFEHLFDRPRDAYLLALLAVTIGPLMEELFFRGFMYPVLERRMGAVWAVALTALPFGLLHLQQYGWAWAAGLVIFLVGVVCGVVRVVTKSVAASFLVHVGYNGTQMLIAIVATHGFMHMEKALMRF
jgi:membrane protease YdiL (CAAX protease family)